MTPPRITGFRVVPPRHDGAGQAVTLAILTVEHALWIIGGLRFSQGADGGYFIRGPERLAGSRDRLTLRAGPERDELVRTALRLFTEATMPHSAAPPVATAPDSMETFAR